MTAASGRLERIGPHLSRRSYCLLCGAEDLVLALPMAASPLADAYEPAERLGEEQPLYPLDLYLCRSCGHLQLPTVVDPDLLFRNYRYVTSSSPGLVDHFHRYADAVVDEIAPPADSLVVEIGSNDGSLLRFFAERGLRVLGVDPGVENARAATASGIETLPEFFTADLACDVRDSHGRASIVAANNVFAHINDLGDVADGVRELLAHDGIFVFEVSYLVDILERMLFDTVYHEHLSYHAIAPLQSFFARHGLELFDVQRVPTKGGSIRGFAQLAGGPREVARVVGEFVALEELMGLERTEVYAEYAERIRAAKEELLDLLRRLKGEGETIAGFGAAHTITTLMFQFGLGGIIDFLVDENPAKQGTFSPRDHIPVLPPSALEERGTRYVVVLAWQYASRIMERHASFVESGGHFIVPLPQLEVV